MKWPNYILEILETLNQKGFQAYLVGGCVRDQVLNIECHDYDITTDATPQQVLDLFHSSASCGMKHGTIIVQKETDVEITTFRKESNYTDHRHPDSVTFVQDLSQDLKRRDFTVNALAYNPQTGIIDLFHGLEDCQNKIIRTISDPNESFNEDALRMLRAFRFCAKLHFEMDEHTFQAINHHAQDIQYISKERIHEELTEILYYDPFQIEKMVDLLYPIIPELKESQQCTQNSIYHFTNVLHHSLLAISYLPEFDETLAYALLFHDLGKPQAKTTKNGIDHFKKHPLYSMEIAKRLCEELKMTSYQKEVIPTLVYYHDDGFKKGMDSIYYFRIELGWNEKMMDDLITIRRCDLLAHSKKGQETLKQLDEFVLLYEQVKKSSIFNVKELDINGNDIISNTNLKGKQIKEALNACLKYCFYHPEQNKKELLLEYIGELWS